MAQEKKKPNRTGKPLNLALTAELAAGVDSFLAAQTVPPTKTALARTALQDYLIRMGFLRARKTGQRPPAPHSPQSSPGGDFGLWYVSPVAAGDPLEIFDHAHEWVDIGRELGGDGRYVFRVRGDSMTDERIFDGDYVIIQRDPEPKAGDKVIARHNGSLTLKKLMVIRGTEVRLVSCDGKAKSFTLDASRGDAVLGKYVASYRKDR